MQLEAPSPIPVMCTRIPVNRPDYLGADYHGEIPNKQAAELLENKPDGAYLVRSSPSANGEFYALSLRYSTRICCKVTSSNHYEQCSEMKSESDGCMYFVGLIIKYIITSCTMIR